MPRIEQRIQVRAPRRVGSPSTAMAYRTLLHALYEAVLITDIEGRIRDANPRAERFLRVPREGLPGRSVFDIVAGCDERVLTAIGRNLDEGRFTVLDAYCRRQDGTVFPAEIAVSRLGKGPGAFLVFSVRNIARRRRAEAKLRREAEAQMARAREQDHFSGLLNILSMADVVQLIDACRKSGELAIFDKRQQETGRIGFAEGRAVFVRCAGNRGPEAFQELMRRGGTSFVFEQGEPEERDASIDASTMGLLLDASRVLDEEAAEEPE